MLHRLKVMLQSIRDSFAERAAAVGDMAANAARTGAARTLSGLAGAKGTLVVLGVLGVAGYVLYKHPPMQSVGRGEVGVRVNQLTGGVSEWRDGSVFVMPGLHDMRRYSLRDRTYQPEQIRRADGAAPLQSVEGLSLGVDLSVRYALDPAKVGAMSKNLPDNIGARNRRAGGAGRDLQDICALHRARDLLDQARRDPAGDRDRARRPSSPPTASCCARCTWARWTCRPTTGAAWKGCWPKSWRRRRCATRWS